MISALDMLIVHHLFNELPLSCTSFIGKFVVAIVSISSLFVIIANSILVMVSILSSIETESLELHTKRSKIATKVALRYIGFGCLLMIIFAYFGAEYLMIFLCWNIVP